MSNFKLNPEEFKNEVVQLEQCVEQLQSAMNQPVNVDPWGKDKLGSVYRDMYTKTKDKAIESLNKYAEGLNKTQENLINTLDMLMTIEKNGQSVLKK